MSFSLPNTVLQQPNETAKQLMKKIANRQNGDVSDSMKKLGYNYEINYGVSIPIIKSIAQTTKPNHSVAVLLRQFSNIREALILSSFIDEPQKITPDKTIDICKLITTQELAQQFAKNLFAHVSPIPHLLSPEFNKNNLFYSLCFWSLGWSIKFNKNTDNQYIELIINELKNSIYYTDNTNSIAIQFVMQAIASKSQYTSSINNLTQQLSNSDVPNMVKTAKEYIWLQS